LPLQPTAPAALPPTNVFATESINADLPHLPATVFPLYHVDYLPTDDVAGMHI
jgi:hypothetical protein